MNSFKFYLIVASVGCTGTISIPGSGGSLTENDGGITDTDGAGGGPMDMGITPDMPPPPPACKSIDPGPYDCETLPDTPIECSWTTAATGEDLAFDAEGNLVSMSGGAVVKTAYGGTPEVFALPPASGWFVRGMRYLPTGELVLSDDASGGLVGINEKGEARQIISGLSIPDGIVVHLNGDIYVSEAGGGRVLRVNPNTGAYTVIAEGLPFPNGVAFSPNYDVLYMGQFGGGLYSIELDSAGDPAGPATLFPDFGGTGGFDGLAVDECGNIYVCDYSGWTVYRVTPDGQATAIFGYPPGSYSWLANLQFGSGIGGWNREALYFATFASSYEAVAGVGPTELPYP